MQEEGKRKIEERMIEMKLKRNIERDKDKKKETIIKGSTNGIKKDQKEQRNK